MNKDNLEKKIKELEELKVRIKKKEKEVEDELVVLRLQYYKIIEKEALKKKEEELRNPPNTSFLDNDEWSGFA